MYQVIYVCVISGKNQASNCESQVRGVSASSPGPEILAPTRIRTPASYARSESLHGRLSPGPYYNLNTFKIIIFLKGRDFQD